MESLPIELYGLALKLSDSIRLVEHATSLWQCPTLSENSPLPGRQQHKAGLLPLYHTSHRHTPDCCDHLSTCTDVAVAFGITVDDLTNWNPSLANLTSCVLDDSVQHCVQTYEITQNVTQYCNQWALADPGLTCQQFANQYGADAS